MLKYCLIHFLLAYHFILIVIFRNKMKIQLLAICTLSIFCIAFANASGEYCYKDVIDACGVRGLFCFLNCYLDSYLCYSILLMVLYTGSNLVNCNARYGAFTGDDLLKNVQHYARAHIQRSFQFLLMVNIFQYHNQNLFIYIYFFFAFMLINSLCFYIYFLK